MFVLSNLKVDSTRERKLTRLSEGTLGGGFVGHKLQISSECGGLQLQNIFNKPLARNHTSAEDGHLLLEEDVVAQRPRHDPGLLGHIRQGALDLHTATAAPQLP